MFADKIFLRGACNMWLGCEDSNLGMPGSKPGALPLGDTPTNKINTDTNYYLNITTCLYNLSAANDLNLLLLILAISLA